MIITDFDPFGISITPFKADPPLVVNSDTLLPFYISRRDIMQSEKHPVILNIVKDLF